MTVNAVSAQHAKEVTEATGVSLSAMRKGLKRREHVEARRQLWWRLAVVEGWSFPRTARVTGGQNHTTVLHGIRVMAKQNGYPTKIKLLRNQFGKPQPPLVKWCDTCGHELEVSKDKNDDPAKKDA